jgi:hypothetical protein
MIYFKEKEQLLFTSQQRKDRNFLGLCDPMKKMFPRKKLLKLSKTKLNEASNKKLILCQTNKLKEQQSLGFSLT